MGKSRERHWDVRIAVPLLFTASGTAGLMYQVVWSREWVLVFGNTTQAITTTVTAFLAGLGFGALIGGRLSSRIRNPLVLYGALEIGIGILALLMPVAFDVVATVFRGAYLSLPTTTVGLIRFGLAFAALAPVTLLMGMTLPLLTCHLVQHEKEVGPKIAQLYGLNTLGAVIGTVASGFFLIELLGLHATTLIAVVVNLTGGILALALARMRRSAIENGPVVAIQVVVSPGTGMSQRQLVVLAATLVSGFVSLALEVLWTRVLAQGTGSYIYLFVTVLAIYLFGIAAGSLLCQRRVARGIITLETLAECLTGMGFLAVMPLIFSNFLGPSRLVVTAALILPSTILMGYTFPITARLFVARHEHAGRGVGAVYAVNTIGAIAGSFAAGFILIPWLGTNNSILILCIGECAFAGALLAWVSTMQSRHKAIRACAIVLTLGGVSALPVARSTSTQLALSNASISSHHYEDSIATVDTVEGKPINRKLLVGGIGITSLTIDTKLIAYLPKALRPQSKNMLVIALGMGTTFRSAITLGMHTDAVELSPTVPSVMSVYYPDAQKYQNSPLARTIVGDGRNYVRLSDKVYDLIVADPPPPSQSAGTVVLLTKEFYEEAKQRLAPGGVMGTFLPLDSAVCDFKAHLRTFHASFKHTMVFRSVGGYGVFLIGSDQPFAFDAQAVQSIFGSPAAQHDLADAPDFSAHPGSGWSTIIASNIWLRDAQIDAYTGRGPLITDDHPISEYFALHGAFDSNCAMLTTADLKRPIESP